MRLNVPVDDPYGPNNLPYGVYSVPDRDPRCAVRYGDSVVDLALLLADDMFATSTLNPFMAMGIDTWAAVREEVRAALRGNVVNAAVHPIADVEMHLPIAVADYVDFYASEHHASNLGRILRPGNPDPLTPNWKHLPIGYHGRSASIVVSGTNIVRPSGQRKGPGDDHPVFGPTSRLDIEAELAFVVGTGNSIGIPIPVDQAERHIFGVLLFNDWSARDIQQWEYIPLGPNLGKSFACTVSPWIVPLLALDAARVPIPSQEPSVLPYLTLSDPWGLDVDFTVRWNGQVVSRPPYASMYWSPAQMLAHLTSNGAPTRTGDVFASGTISGPSPGEQGSCIEMSHGGTEPMTVGGKMRTFLEDGDEIVLTASAPARDGSRIGFGEARGRIIRSTSSESSTSP